jgi:hypothetical protein
VSRRIGEVATGKKHGDIAIQARPKSDSRDHMKRPNRTCKRIS